MVSHCIPYIFPNYFQYLPVMMILIPLFCWCNPYFWWWKKTPFFTMLDASNPYVSWFNHHVSCFSWWFTTNLQDPIAFTFRLAKVRLKSLCFMLISHHFSPFFMVSTARRCPIPWPTPGLPCAARWTSTPTAARHRSATTPSARAEPEAKRARTEGRWWFWMKRNGIATQCYFLNGV